MWFRTRKGRKKLSVRFLAKLKLRHPRLYQRAIKMNQQDNFVMWDKREKYAHKFVKKTKKTVQTTSEGGNAEMAGGAAAEEENKAESSDDTISSSSSSSSSSSDGDSSSSDGESSDGSSNSSRSSYSGGSRRSANSSKRRSFDNDSSDLDSQGSAKNGGPQTSIHTSNFGSSQPMIVDDGLGGAMSMMNAQNAPSAK